MSKPEFNAKLIQRIDINADVALFQVKPDNGVIADFKAGQFTTLGLPYKSPRCKQAVNEEKPGEPEKFVQRAYSIGSTPLIKDYLEFYITLVKNGRLTPRLWELKVGDALYLSNKITGHFILDDVDENQNIILIATGTGLAPYISMLQTHCRPTSKRKWAVFHGVRQSQDLAYRTFLMTLSKMNPNFFYFPIISRPQDDPTGWNGLSGRVPDLWKNKVVEKVWNFKPQPDNTHIYLCGHPDMITQMTLDLVNQGYKEHSPKEAGQIHTEKYW